MPHSRQFDPISPSQHGVRPSPESGFLLLFVIFLAALMLIALAVAAPRVAKSIQRDREMELVHRGDQYKHAIKLYYQKFGTYPTSIDQLINTNNIRFLRKRYKDPLDGKDDWRIIHLGQAKVPPLGFFGQPLGMPGSNIGTPVGTPVGAAPGGAFGSSTPGTLPSNPFGSSNDQSSDNSDDSGQAPVESNQTTTITGAPPGFGPAQTSGMPGATGTPGAPTTAYTPFGSSSSSEPGSNLGGGPIVGVGLPSPKASLIIYKKQKHYNQWEFVYNPIEDQMQAAAAALNGGGIQSMNGSNGTMDNNNTGFGNSNNSNGGFGNSSNNSNSPFGSDNSTFPGATTTPPNSNQPQP